MRLSRLVASAYLVFALAAFGLSQVIGPLGYAPFPLALGPAGEPITITISYGTEKEAWLQEAVQRFQAENITLDRRPIQVTLDPAGSREIPLDIAQGTRKPTAISPASSIQIEILRGEWAARGNAGDVIGTGSDAPQPLVITPLVLVAWKARAEVLWPNGPGDLWDELQVAAADPQGWAKLGKPEWGFVKFGHTSPETSNSGTQALLLMAYAYHDKTSGLTTGDVLDAGFQEWLLGIEQSVLEFGNSTGTFMTDMIRFGPGKYDMVAVYENLAIQDVENARNRWNQDIQVYYPPATILSDHPFAVLNAPWVTPEQKQAAAVFRTYLLSEPIQQLALRYGFRPAAPNVPIQTSDPENPFNKYQGYGIQVDINQQVEVPPADVLNTLIDLWRRRVKQTLTK